MVKLQSNLYSNKNVIVLGDAMVDQYTDGFVARVSQEAPVPIIQHKETVFRAGGAAHVALAVAGLGANANFLSLTGKDGASEELQSIFATHPKLNAYIYECEGQSTLIRHRIMSGETMMIRLDHGEKFTQDLASQAYLTGALENLWPKTDVLIISDYEYGVITEEIILTIERLLKTRHVIVAVDARNLSRFKKLRPNIVKPNHLEAQKMLGLEAAHDRDEAIGVLKQRERELLQITGSEYVLLTLGSSGVLCMSSENSPVHVAPPFVSKQQESGAGDSFVAASALALAGGLDVLELAHFANAVAAMSIEKGSTGVTTIGDLRHLQGNSKLHSRETIVPILDRERALGRTIVFTNGCFDLLHPGHVKLLTQAKSEGDILVLGVNMDESVRRLKGNTRPINTFEDRCAVLAGLESVDYIVGFDEDTPESLIAHIRPHVFAKAGYTLDQLPEAAIIRKLNGKIKLFDTIPGSTTDIIARISR